MSGMIVATELPPRLAEAVKRETERERIRWSGRPIPRSAFRTGMLVWLFAVPWTAFALFWEWSVVGGLLFGKAAAKAGATGHAFTWGMGLLGLPFVLIGLAMLAAPWGLARSARNTIHIVTDKRLVSIRANRFSTKVKTIWPNELVSIERTEKPDGTGDLTLVLGSRRDSDGDKVTLSETLSGVPEVRRAERTLIELRDDRRAA